MKKCDACGDLETDDSSIFISDFLFDLYEADVCRDCRNAWTKYSLTSTKVKKLLVEKRLCEANVEAYAHGNSTVHCENNLTRLAEIDSILYKIAENWFSDPVESLREGDK